MARPKGIPGYLHHKASGRAYVRINGNDIYLGFHNSKESKAEYDRLIREWLANNRLLPQKENCCEAITVNSVCLLFLEHAKSYYRKNGKLTSEYSGYKTVSRFLHDHCGTIPAVAFTRQSLKTIREQIAACGWKRKTVNDRIKKIKHIF